MKTTLIRALCIFSLATAACSPRAKLVAPSGFAHLEGDYDDRVGTARGVVVGARAVRNDPKANLEFWTEAVDLRMKARGYVAEEPKDVKTDAGLVGRSLRYTRDASDRKLRYWATLFLDGDRVLVVEATGEARDFDAQLAQVEQTIAHARVD